MATIDAAEVIGDNPMALYRLYAEDGTLLYVGITHSLSVRFADHAMEKRWWPLVARKTVEWYGDRDSVEAAEDAAILAENPEHNIRGKRRERFNPDRHKPDNKTFTLRPPEDVRAYIAEQAERGVSRSALIYQALREKRDREGDHATASDAS